MTLVEVLVAVMILGVAFVALLGGFGTSIASSDLHRKQAVAETAIRRYAEAIKDEPFSTTCPPTYTGSFTVPSGFTKTAPVVEGYIDTNTNIVTTTCSALKAQVVAVSITSEDGRVSPILRVVKRPQ